MNILALDPAFATCGVVVINDIMGILVHDELILTECLSGKGAKTKARKKGLPIPKMLVADDLDRRTHEMSTALVRVIRQFSPDLIIIETSAASARDAKAARSLGIIKGIVWAIAASHDLPVVAFGAKAIKETMTGDPNASKRALMAVAVGRFPQLRSKWTNKSTGNLLNDFEHVSDAVCAYLTYKQH